MLDQLQLRRLIIQPVLKGLSLYSENSEEILVGTCAQETKGGSYLIQEFKKDEDPIQILKTKLCALGPYGMEYKTHDDLWKTFLPSRPKITNDLMQICTFSKKPTAEMMIYNLYYATAMARIFYLKVQETIPATLELQADYYKAYWNTSLGKATTAEYIVNYNLFMGIKTPKGEKK
jgi:hypothetical protein